MPKQNIKKQKSPKKKAIKKEDVSQIADEMRRVQEEWPQGRMALKEAKQAQLELNALMREQLEAVRDPLLEIPSPWPEVEKKLKEQISFWRIGAITLMCLLPFGPLLGMFTQSQFPQDIQKWDVTSAEVHHIARYFFGENKYIQATKKLGGYSFEVCQDGKCVGPFEPGEQSQLPQKPRLSEINLCMHLGRHWNATAGECE